jgi:hypothetical protein
LETDGEMKMKVYLVLGGWDYEGCDDDSAVVFSSKESAEAYVANESSISEYDPYKIDYDFYKIVELEVQN